MIFQFIDNAGEVVARAKDTFSRSAERKFRDRLPYNSIHHMRVGRFSVVLPENLAECICAPTYPEDEPPTPIAHGDVFFASARNDRLDQLDRIAVAIQPTHPHFAAVMDEIAKERLYYGMEPWFDYRFPSTVTAKYHDQGFCNISAKSVAEALAHPKAVAAGTERMHLQIKDGIAWRFVTDTDR
jgi:hypothetical protein